MIELEPGMLVRCVVPDCGGVLQLGGEYLVVDVDTLRCVTLWFTDGRWAPDRFKPVIRVKAKSEHVAGSNRATYSRSDLAVYSMRRLRDFAAGVHADSKP